MLSMMGVGALLATTALILLGSRVVRGGFTVGAAFGYPAIMVAFALSRSFTLSLCLLLLLGFMEIVGGTLRNTIVQVEVEESYRGRVMGLMSTASRGASPLGAVPVGALAGAIGTPLAVALGGVAALAIAATTVLRVPRIARFNGFGPRVEAGAPLESAPAAAAVKS